MSQNNTAGLSNSWEKTNKSQVFVMVGKTNSRAVKFEPLHSQVQGNSDIEVRERPSSSRIMLHDYD